MLEKIEANGKNTHDVYKFLRLNASDLNKKKGQSAEIPWNFAKFLVDRNGMVQTYYEPKRNPESIRADIIKMLE